jgi:hypothetical protein
MTWRFDGRDCHRVDLRAPFLLMTTVYRLWSGAHI